MNVFAGMLPSDDAVMWAVQSACVGSETTFSDEEKWYPAKRYYLWIL